MLVYGHISIDVPHWKALVITCQENEAYFTAVIELGDMFDGGGVPIDHYIIQVDNGTQLETADPTYSFDIMYNTTLSVNISAHNCAGYSDPFPLEIEYEQGRTKNGTCAVTDSQEHISTVTTTFTVMSALTAMNNKSPIPTMLITRPTTKNSTVFFIAVPVTSAAITVIIMAMIILYILRRYSKCLFVRCLIIHGSFAREVK